MGCALFTRLIVHVAELRLWSQSLRVCEIVWESLRVHIVPSHTTPQNSVFEGLGVITAPRQSLISEVF